MNKLILSCVFLTACTSANTAKIPSAIQENSTVSFESTQFDTIVQLPEELTIEYFSNMRLEGKDLQIAKVLADNAAYTRYEIRYTSNGLTISGIMNVPKGEGPFPLVILNHGYIDPTIYTVGRGLKREQDYLARNGFAVLHTDYRGHGASDPSPDTKEIYDASLEYAMDSINAVHAVRNSTLKELRSVDATRIGMLGHSLGGGLTLNILVAHPDMINAAVLYAPVSGDAHKNFDRWRKERPEGDRTIAAFGEKGSEAWQKISSINYLSRIDDPVLLFHGTSDDDVPIAWSQELYEYLSKEQKAVNYIVYDNEEHEFISQFNDFMRQTVDFLSTHLLKRSTSVIERGRITKKPFGLYVTPEHSPVSPERFTGYHVGADFELREGEDPLAMHVMAICAGEILYKKWVKGYGGVVVQSCNHNENPITVLYGHINLDSVQLTIGDSVSYGEYIATLGKGYSEETDGERPHVHIGLHKGTEIELKGYALDAESVYSKWIDPLELL